MAHETEADRAATPPPEGDTSAPVYSAPAVDKSLDVLELLASAPGPLSQNQIAAATGRTVAQIFRVLSVLERRGYIARERDSGQYLLTLRLFDLAHRADPLRTLLTLADAPLRELAARVGQSCNLGVRDGDEVLVVAEADSRSDFGFRVRVGARFPLIGPPSGELLLAYGPEADRAKLSAADRSRLDEFRAQGFAEKTDHLHLGVVDLAFPVLDAGERIVATLTVPYVATSWSEHPLDVVRERAAATAATIGELLRGASARSDQSSA